MSHTNVCMSAVLQNVNRHEGFLVRVDSPCSQAAWVSSDFGAVEPSKVISF